MTWWHATTNIHYYIMIIILPITILTYHHITYRKTRTTHLNNYKTHTNDLTQITHKHIPTCSQHELYEVKASFMAEWNVLSKSSSFVIVESWCRKFTSESDSHIRKTLFTEEHDHSAHIDVKIEKSSSTNHA